MRPPAGGPPAPADPCALDVARAVLQRAGARAPGPATARSPGEPPAPPPLAEADHAVLHFLFGKHWENALELVDNGHVKCVVGRGSGRRVFQVRGATARKGGDGGPDLHVVFPTSYCSCFSFFHNVVGAGNAALCKHQLTALAAQALGKAVTVLVPDAQVAEVLLAGA